MKLGRIDGPVRRSIGVCPCVGTGPPTCTKWPTLMSHHRLSTTLVPRATSDFAVFGEKRSHRPRFFLTPTCAPAQGVCAQTAGVGGRAWGGGVGRRGGGCLARRALLIERAEDADGLAVRLRVHAMPSLVQCRTTKAVQFRQVIPAVPSACRVEAVGASVRGCD